MAAYLLTCECGKQVPIELGQAGGKVACSCSKQLDVPTLRQLRQLPQAAAEQAKTSSGSWGTRQGWVTACLVIAAVLAAWSVWIFWHQPAQPKFEADVYLTSVDKVLQAWTPADAWHRWLEYYKPLAERGLPVFQAGNAAQIEGQIAHDRFRRGMLMSIAGVFAAVAATVYFWPAAAPLAAPRREARRP